MDKLITAKEAASKLKDGMTVMIGGFLANGTPEKIVDELVKSGVKDLTLIVNDTSFVDKGNGRLVDNKQIKKVIVSHIGTNPRTAELMNSGEMEVEFSPQGSLAERIRCGGMGLGGALTKTGMGTIVAEGKQVVEIDGEQWLLEKPLRADVAFIKASKGDTMGNLVYHGTTMNFNPLMAMAADCVVAEVEELVSPGMIAPHEVHTASIFVNHIVK